MSIEAAIVNISGVGEEGDLNVHMSEESIVGIIAFVCAFISIMGFLSVVPWQLICRAREEYVAAKLGNSGLRKKAIRALSSLVYTKLRWGVDSVECPICLADFIEGEKVRVLPKCKHSFHMACVDKWFASHSSCPTCRHCLLQREIPHLQCGTNQIQCSRAREEHGEENSATDIECGVEP